MKNMKKLFCFALAVVMLLSVMAGCAAKTEQSPSTTQASESTASTETASNESADASDAAATDGEIDIAFIGNTTGDYAQYGIPVRNAVMLYFDQLNAAGGINGKKVVVKEYDDKGDGV